MYCYQTCAFNGISSILTSDNRVSPCEITLLVYVNTCLAGKHRN